MKIGGSPFADTKSTLKFSGTHWSRALSEFVFGSLTTSEQHASRLADLNVAHESRGTHHDNRRFQHGMQVSLPRPQLEAPVLIPFAPQR
jgi:hypothetical protein